MHFTKKTFLFALLHYFFYCIISFTRIEFEEAIPTCCLQDKNTLQDKKYIMFGNKYPNNNLSREIRKLY